MTELTDLVSVPSFHEDTRRRITDVTGTVKFFQIAGQEELRLGNHYHKHTDELFYVIDGKLTFKLENIETKERQEYVVEPGQAITMPFICCAFGNPRAKVKIHGIGTASI